MWCRVLAGPSGVSLLGDLAVCPISGAPSLPEVVCPRRFSHCRQVLVFCPLLVADLSGVSLPPVPHLLPPPSVVCPRWLPRWFPVVCPRLVARSAGLFEWFRGFDVVGCGAECWPA